ncbi:hypothetical protein KKA53_00860 [Candidatus Dependentiae bacterium]|nr:hypothetical protein [Candidatus Dependentiae bacterium]
MRNHRVLFFLCVQVSNFYLFGFALERDPFDIPPFAENLVRYEREKLEKTRCKKEKRASEPSRKQEASYLTKNMRRFLYRQYDDPILREKKISLVLQDTDIREAFGFLSEKTGFNFIVDPDVSGVVSSICVKEVPIALALRTLLASNRPRLALLKDNGLFRVVRLSNAKEILLELEDQDCESAAVLLAHRHLSEKQKKQMRNVWEGVTADYFGKQKFYLVFSDVSRQVIFKGKKHHVTQFKKYLKNIDHQVPRVKIEARFVCAEKGFEENVGFQWSGIYNRRASVKRGFDFIGVGKPLSAISNNPTQQPRESLIDWALNFLPTPDKVAKNLRLPFVFGGNDLNTKRLNLVLNAAENRREIETILQPSVLTNDKEMAQILVGENVPIETIIEESVEGRLRNVKTAQYKDIGIQLKVLPIVAPDQRSVFLDVYIENSQQSDALATSQATYPVIRTTRSHTKVRLRSGQTTMISGLLKDIKELYKTRDPLLGRIPFLGALFRGRRRVKQNMQLLIFITPTIVT